MGSPLSQRGGPDVRGSETWCSRLSVFSTELGVFGSFSAEKYILKEGKVVPVQSFIEWAQWMEANKEACRVDFTDIGDKHVSTVFLGLNHRWGDGPPLLFETMVFGNEVLKGKIFDREFEHHESFDDYTQRYSTLEEAKRGHRKVVAKLKGILKVVSS